jgi:glycosyltransferase involved in cell wall biosynthesis
MIKKLIKVLYLCPNGYLGGAERFVLEAVKSHSEGPIKAKIIFFERGAALDLAKTYGLDFEVCPHRFRMRYPWQVLRVIFWMRSLFKREAPDIFHSTMPYIHILGLLASWGTSIKKVWYQHGPVGGVWDRVAHRFESDVILFNSNFLKKEHLKMKGAPKARSGLRIIPPGIAFEGSDRLDSEKIIKKYKSKNELLVLQAGRLSPLKGFENHLRAWGKLFNKYPEIKERVKILIIGEIGRQEDQPYKVFLKEEVIEQSLESNVFFLGHQDRIQDYFRACDLQVHSSIVLEPFGLVNAEAMAEECLVIGPNRGGVADILISEKTGFGYDSTSSHNINDLFLILEEKILPMIGKKREEIYPQIKAQALSHIKQNFSIEKMNNDLEELYKELVN